jgi:hypothetical protein
MKPAMPTLDEHDIVLMQRIKRHPLLRARVESLLGVMEDAEGGLEKADAAERRVIEELRHGFLIKNLIETIVRSAPLKFWHGFPGLWLTRRFTVASK